MSRWQIKTQERSGLTRLEIIEDGKVVGVVTMTVRSYNDAVRDVILKLTNIAQKTNFETLERRLMADAQVMTAGQGADAAVEKMQSFGLTKERVDAYSSELALMLGQRLVELLP